MRVGVPRDVRQVRVGLGSHLSGGEDRSGGTRANQVGVDRYALEERIVRRRDDRLNHLPDVDSLRQRLDDEVGVARLLPLVQLAANERNPPLLRVAERSSAHLRLWFRLLLRVETALDTTLVASVRLTPLASTLATATAGTGKSGALLDVDDTGGGVGLATEDLGGECEGTETDRVELERGGAAGGEDEGGVLEDVADEGFLKGLLRRNRRERRIRIRRRAK